MTDLAPRLKDATSAVESLVPLVNAVESLLTTPSGIVAVVCVFIWLITRAPSIPIFTALSKKRSGRLAKMEEYIEKNHVRDTNAVAVIQDIYDAEMFALATTIYAERRWREGLIELHRRVHEVASWQGIAKAYPFMEFDASGLVSIRAFHFLDNIFYWVNNCVAVASALTVALLFAAIWFYPGLDRSAMLHFGGGAVVLLFVAGFSVVQNAPRFIAKKIHKHLMCSAENAIAEP